MLFAFATGFDEMAESNDQHGIAREHGSVGVPLLMHRGLAAPHVGVVHKVVVQKRVVVVGFKSYGQGQRGVDIVLKERVRKQQQRGAQPLAAHGEHVADGLVKSLGLSGVRDIRQIFFNLFCERHGVYIYYCIELTAF